MKNLYSNKQKQDTNDLNTYLNFLQILLYIW